LRKYHLVILASALLLMLSSCGGDTEVGSGLLSSDELEIVEVTDFDIRMTHMSPEPIEQPISNFIRRHSLGTLDDPLFGQLAASFYVRPVVALSPVFEGGTLDSVALALRIDSTRTYGLSNAQHNIVVYHLEEPIDNVDSIFTNEILALEAEPIGRLDRLNPEDIDSFPILDLLTRDTTLLDGLIRVPLDLEFGQMIFDDELNNGDPVGFESLVNGFYVTSTSNNSLLQLDLADLNSSLLFFYKDSLGDARNFTYPFGSQAPVIFEYDIAGSQMESAIADPTNQSTFFLQGHAGTIIEIDIADILREQDRFVNFTTLDFYVNQEITFDTSRFALPDGLDLFVRNEDDNLVPILDLEIAVNAGQIGGIFNGFRETRISDDVIRYQMNITNYIKELFAGSEDRTTLYLIIRNRVETPNNVILYGPDHPDFPATLRLTYTNS